MKFLTNKPINTLKYTSSRYAELMKHRWRSKFIVVIDGGYIHSIGIQFIQFCIYVGTTLFFKPFMSGQDMMYRVLTVRKGYPKGKGRGGGGLLSIHHPMQHCRLESGRDIVGIRDHIVLEKSIFCGGERLFCRLTLFCNLCMALEVCDVEILVMGETGVFEIGEFLFSGGVFGLLRVDGEGMIEVAGRR
jgi:hypothetical protein